MPVDKAGRAYSFSAGPGMGVQSLLTKSAFNDVNGSNADAQVFGAEATTPLTPKVNYLWYLLGVLILLVVLKYVTEHEKSGMDVKLVGIGAYNYVAVGIMSMLFFIVTKTLLNKYPVKGLTNLVNAA